MGANINPVYKIFLRIMPCHYANTLVYAAYKAICVSLYVNSSDIKLVQKRMPNSNQVSPSAGVPYWEAI